MYICISFNPTVILDTEVLPDQYVPFKVHQPVGRYEAKIEFNIYYFRFITTTLLGIIPREEDGVCIELCGVVRQTENHAGIDYIKIEAKTECQAF